MLLQKLQSICDDSRHYVNSGIKELCCWGDFNLVYECALVVFLVLYTKHLSVKIKYITILA